jgi:hypothetical protein
MWEAFLAFELLGEFPYVFLDGAAEAAMGQRSEERLGAGSHRRGAEQLSGDTGSERRPKEDKASWTSFIRELKQRGLKGVRLFVSDYGRTGDRNGFFAPDAASAPEARSSSERGLAGFIERSLGLAKS